VEPGSGQSSPISSAFNEPRPGEPLPLEAEQILSEIPSFIGGEPGAAAGAGAIHEVDPELSADDIAEMIPDIDFEEGEVREVLEEAFEWLAGRFDSDHWKLTERQSRMLGRPTTRLLTSVYSRLAQFLPGWLATACETTPGLAGVIIVSAMVIGPKAAKQFKIHRARKGSVQTIEGNPGAAQARQPNAPPRRPAPSGAVGAIAGADEPLPFAPE